MQNQSADATTGQFPQPKLDTFILGRGSQLQINHCLQREWLAYGAAMLRLHNNLTREKQDFVPADPAHVTIYVCGPTVYGAAHIGNARPAVVFDVLVRLLRDFTKSPMPAISPILMIKLTPAPRRKRLISAS